jgi:hypothetical protein
MGKARCQYDPMRWARGLLISTEKPLEPPPVRDILGRTLRILDKAAVPLSQD